MPSRHFGIPAHADAGKVAAPRRTLLSERTRKLLSYYKPYPLLLTADLACAFLAAGATLLLPLCANIITKTLLADGQSTAAMAQIYTIGSVMLALIVVQAAATVFVDYQGHMMGAKMEG